MSEAEELFVLRGIRRRTSACSRIEGAPEYEFFLQMFNQEQAFTFIERYAPYKAERESALRDHSVASDETTRRLAGVRVDEQLKKLLSDPFKRR